MLMSAFRTIVNNLLLENFDIIFIENEKKTAKTLNFFFQIKNFFNWIFNQCSKDTR